MRKLLAATCLTPVALMTSSTAAWATTSISTASTANLSTSTAASGTADDISITSAGSVKPAAGTAVTIDSNNSVTNAGAISFEDVDNATGIGATTGSAGTLAGTITNSGTISLTESTTATDSDSDGDNDGPLATGTGRYGVHIAGTGSFTGNIVDSGTTTIEGNASAGIAIDGALIGNLTESGTIAVTGDNGYAIHLNSVTGNVVMGGTLSVVGANATGLAIDGDVTGALTLQGAVTATGYRSTAITGATAIAALDADDLLQGGPAVSIAGNVAGGVLLDAPPTDTDTANTDEDGDGVADADEKTNAIYSYGSAPALRIGSASKATAIGAVSGSDYGLVNKGVIDAFGTYNAVDATALQIGGLGGTVAIAGGLSNSGTIGAYTVSGNAVAVDIGDGATVPAIVNSGTITAQGTATDMISSQAILIRAGASVASITNSGTISAVAVGTGTSGAIVDLSGGLTSIVNQGAISATTAIDLSANATGVAIDQSLSSVTDAAAPSIVGAILTGSGNDRISASDGLITGAITTGAGADLIALSGDTILTGAIDMGAGDDSLTLAGTSAYIGTASFGSGSNSLTIDGGASFSGAIDSGGGLAVSVTNGSLKLTGTPTVALTSLSIGASGVVGIDIDPVAGTNTRFDVAGTASITAGARLSISVSSLVNEAQSFTVLTAGTLTGSAGLTAVSADLPYLYASTITASDSTSAGGGTVNIDLRRKTASELGLTRSRAAAYDAIYAALGTDSDMAGVFTGLTTQASFMSAYAQMMPIESGGVFEAATQGSRAFARAATDDGTPRVEFGSTGFWLQEIAWTTTKKLDANEGYSARGWGFGGGMDQRIDGFGRVGISLAYMADEVAVPHNRNNLFASQFELTGYWSGEWGGFHADARGSFAHLSMRSTRYFDGMLDGDDVERTAKDRWGGLLASAGGGISYQARFGSFSIRPVASIDYYRLSEQAHSESGGGTAFDLSIAHRTSDELAASGSVAVGYELSRNAREGSFSRIEIEGGRRQILAGALGDTVANYADGDQYRLTAEERASGYLGRVRVTGGNEDFRIGGEVSAEQQQSRTALAVRASLRIGL
jgi:uncharacterized protein with beta-barrel porin domain